MTTQHQRECNDRKEDKWPYKIMKVAALLTAVGGIAGGTVKLLSYEFVQATQFQEVQDSIDKRFNKVEIDQTRVSQKLDDIGSDVKEIRRVLDRR